MALMTYREADQKRWVGARPAHHGTQVIASNTAIGSTAVIITVSAGKVFYWTHLAYTMNNSAAAGNAYVGVRNASDVVQYKPMNIVFDAVGQLALHTPFSPPIELAAGWDIVVYSSLATVDLRGFVHGWEE